MSNEEIYFVDKNDTPTGETSEKLTAHHANTKLHAAFSSYIFNESGKLLVTQRAHIKKVWHGVWTNSCCGHPAPGENRENAIHRRLQYELGLRVEELLLVVPEYIYKTPPYNGIVEHEFCPIYVGIVNTNPIPNPEEVADFAWIDWQEYVDTLKSDNSDYSVFAKNVPADDALGKHKVPKWSWWAKDQLSYLEKSKTFQDFLDRLELH